jgi:hypothetical protein
MGDKVPTICINCGGWATWHANVQITVCDDNECHQKNLHTIKTRPGVEIPPSKGFDKPRNSLVDFFD